MYKIAIIDDENDILNLLERFLQRAFDSLNNIRDIIIKEIQS